MSNALRPQTDRFSGKLQPFTVGPTTKQSRRKFGGGITALGAILRRGGTNTSAAVQKSANVNDHRAMQAVTMPEANANFLPPESMTLKHANALPEWLQGEGGLGGLQDGRA